MRRVFWNIYAWPMTLLLITAAGLTLARERGLLAELDLAISLPAVVALHLHIWDKRFLSARFWKPYAFAFPIWDALFNIVLEPRSSGERFNPWYLFVPVFLLPLYASVFRYAFRRWDGNGLPTPPLLPTTTPVTPPAVQQPRQP